MSIREQLIKRVESLQPDEKIIALDVILDAVLEEAEKAKTDARSICSIPVGKIDPFPDHPFKVENDEDMQDLVRSIRKYGMLTPGTIRRKKGGRYEVLSGHRRLWACRIAGVKMFRCEIVELSDKEAMLYMIEANRQRINLSPSEKGYAYVMKKRLLSEKGFDFTPGEPWDMRITSEDSPFNEKAIKRIPELIPEFREMVDEKKMGLRPAYEISFLPDKMQVSLLNSIEYEQSMPTHAQAIRMRKLSDEMALTAEMIGMIMSEEKPNQKQRVVLNDEKTLAYIPSDIPADKQADYIARALAFYSKHRG